MPSNSPTPRSLVQHPSRSARAGFSITELLVVIFIIVLIIGITVPALSSARTSARRTETSQLLNDLSQGVSQFTLDQDRQPGYFSVSDMGHSENETEGFSQMQNIMIDMLGGLVPASTPDAPNILTVGPRTDATSKIKLDRNRINLAQAGGPKLYWASLSSKVFERADENGVPLSTGVERRVGAIAGTNDNTQIREIVDAFGAPVLAWAADDTVRSPVDDVQQFARRNSDTAGAERARVYWASNAAFLKQTGPGGNLAIGTSQIRQDGNGTDSRASILSEVVQPFDSIERSLTGLLGNPGSPKNPTEPQVLDILPTGVLAPITFHSAGRDGIWLGGNSNAAKKLRKQGNFAVLDYGVNVRDKIVEQFDDVVQPAN